MPLFDLILKDLNQAIDDELLSAVDSDQFSHQEDAYYAGAESARQGAEKYLREIFPEA